MLYLGQRIKKISDDETKVYYLGTILDSEDEIKEEYKLPDDTFDSMKAYLIKEISPGNAINILALTHEELVGGYEIIRGEKGEICGLEHTVGGFFGVLPKRLVDNLI